MFEHCSGLGPTLALGKYAGLTDVRDDIGGLIRRRFRRSHWTAETLSDLLDKLQALADEDKRVLDDQIEEACRDNELWRPLSLRDLHRKFMKAFT